MTPPPTTAAIPPSLIPYNVPPAAYLATHPHLTNLVVSALIIHAPTGRALLIQRAAHDGFPLKWECPGGQVDAGADATVLHALCREVREETGLALPLPLPLPDVPPDGLLDGPPQDGVAGAAEVADVLDTIEFPGGGGSNWRKITFLVLLAEDDGDEKLPPPVRLDEREHQDAVWATGEEVQAGRCEGREIVFAYEGQRELVLDVLRRRERE
ncbi:9881f552-8aea-4952-9409-db24573c0106 [Thermothielavioides terrestris]|uniref:9881f552-8aea-4952-9409-db24573c0106 n=1 Tax=Thermothielavioides terrestris TaxID=2587410 RepID=A0A3S4AQF7_9PEZI|nr:9881f552-8aea-4952-9409-db24573c0106 [Thermothielavioides terrestris]